MNINPFTVYVFLVATQRASLPRTRQPPVYSCGPWTARVYFITHPLDSPTDLGKVF